MNSLNRTGVFDAYYFAHGCGRPYQHDEEWLRFFGAIAERIVSDIRPQSVLDAGCAMGFLVEALRQRDVEAFGIDVSEYAIQNAPPDAQPYCRLGSITEGLSRHYDLIVCIEVLEHLPPPEAEQAIRNFCQYSDDVLFSSTPFDYKEATHFNVQSPEYWAEQFARQGFVRDVDFDASFITPWAVRFRRSREPLHRIVRAYERRFWLLWKENTDLRSLASETRDQLAAGEQVRQSLVRLVAQKDAQLKDIANSQGWKFVEWLGRMRLRLAPRGSRRERLFLKLSGRSA